MQKPRDRLFVTSHKGKLWAIGGRNASDGDLSSVEVYNPEFNVWTETEIPMVSIKGSLRGCTFSSKYFN